MTKKTIGCDNCHGAGYLIEKKGDLSFARICDCVLRCREGNGSGSVFTENEVLLPLIETEVLVIDELGKGRSSEWELNILDQLISKRYNASKITLITTNYVSEDNKQKKGSGHSSQNEDQETLENRVGSRIASRLREMCEFIPIEGDGQTKTEEKNVYNAAEALQPRKG